MIDASPNIVNARPTGMVDEENGLPRLVQPISLGIITLISIFMNFYQLGQNGFANTYYAASVRSMLDNWHAFFFVSLDPVGFVTVDKPPLGFWLQVASARIFGFTPFSVFFPQALAGVISVLLLYHLVRRHFGLVAGLLAALALAVSPISVVTNRNNTIDSTLVLTMLLGAWTVMKAAETGKWRWLMLTAVLVGLGFNIKMLEAYLVVPAYGLLYILAAPRTIRMRILQLFVAALVMVAISLSWALAVDLTPASLRPYVGSTQDNSEISLALGYNGVERLLGQFGSGFGFSRIGNTNTPGTATDSGQPPSGTQGSNGGQPSGTGTNDGGQPPSGTGTNNGGQPPSGTQGFGGGQPGGTTGGTGGGNSGGMFNTGTPGLFRLFNEPLGGQIVWLLPLALFGMLALAWQSRPRLRENREQQSLVLWGVWLLTIAAFFSAAGFFHQYYLSTLAPAICAMFGIGVVVMWRDYRRVGWRGWLLPIALIATALEQIHIISSNTAWGVGFIPVIAIGCAIAAIVLFVARLAPRLVLARVRFLIPALAIGLLALMLTPAVWAAVPAVQNIADDLPVAGPSQAFGGGGGTGGNRFAGGNGQSLTAEQRAELQERFGNRGFNNGEGGPGGAGNGGGNPGGGNVDSALIRYLEANQGSAKYLVAVQSAQEADSIILQTNKGVMALGGFTGSDPILTTDSLAKLVANGTIRFFLLSGNGGFGGGGGGQSSLTSWVTQHCTTVSSSVTGSSGSSQLYSCSPSS